MSRTGTLLSLFFIVIALLLCAVLVHEAGGKPVVQKINTNTFIYDTQNKTLVYYENNTVYREQGVVNITYTNSTLVYYKTEDMPFDVELIILAPALFIAVVLIIYILGGDKK